MSDDESSRGRSIDYSFTIYLFITKLTIVIIDIERYCEKIVKMPIADWLSYITPVQINKQILSSIFSLFILTSPFLVF